MPASFVAMRALRRQFGDLPLERGRDLLLSDRAGALAQLPGIFFSCVRRSIDSTRPPPLRAPSTHCLQLAERLVDQEVRRDEALARAARIRVQVAVELLRDSCEPREIGFGVRRVLRSDGPCRGSAACRDRRRRSGSRRRACCASRRPRRRRRAARSLRARSRRRSGRLRRWCGSNGTERGRSTASARARSARSVCGDALLARCRAVARAESAGAARAPLSRPRRSRFPATGAAGSRAIESSSAGPRLRRQCWQPGRRSARCTSAAIRSGSAALADKAATRLAASSGDMSDKTELRQAGGSVRSGSTMKAIAVNRRMRTRSPALPGRRARSIRHRRRGRGRHARRRLRRPSTLLPIKRARADR